VAWRVEIVDDEAHRGFEYVRFYWPTKKIAWDLNTGSKDNGTKVITYSDLIYPWQIWNLISVNVENTFAPSQLSSETLSSGLLPSYDGEATSGLQPSTCAHHTESEREGFGTIVTEVTTITTHKRYRVEDA